MKNKINRCPPSARRRSGLSPHRDLFLVIALACCGCYKPSPDIKNVVRIVKQDSPGDWRVAEACSPAIGCLYYIHACDTDFTANTLDQIEYKLAGVCR